MRGEAGEGGLPGREEAGGGGAGMGGREVGVGVSSA